MRLMIDASAALFRSAGVKNYVYHWMAHLRRQAGDGDKILGYPFLSDPGRLNHEASVLPFWGTASRVAVLYGVNWFGRRFLDRTIQGADIFHASNQVHCAPGRAKLTATIHDLTGFLMPELHTPANAQADRLFAERILKRADGLIAVSENTRQDAIRLLGIRPERITTIYSGVPEKFLDAAPAKRARPYVLYVGTIEPRKNLTTLLDAWKQVGAELRAEFELVIAGPVGWSAAAAMARIRAEATYVGYVPEEDLPGLVAGATAFVYPSLYEGFGFPVVQAMAAGVPVVTSNVSCLPEVAGDGAVLVDPRSAAEIGAAVARVLESAEFRRELGGRGRVRAGRYRWEACAAESLRFFRRLSGAG
jgi:glycosyltransferase involved in cell wall biosynthesis